MTSRNTSHIIELFKSCGGAKNRQGAADISPFTLQRLLTLQQKLHHNTKQNRSEPRKLRGNYPYRLFNIKKGLRFHHRLSLYFRFFCTISHYLLGVSNEKPECLLYGRDWSLHISYIKFVLYDVREVTGKAAYSPIFGPRQLHGVRAFEYTCWETCLGFWDR